MERRTRKSSVGATWKRNMPPRWGLCFLRLIAINRSLLRSFPLLMGASLIALLILWPVSNTAATTPARQLKLLTPSGYLPQLPMLVRIEVIDPAGRRDWSLWDAEATLTSDSQGVSLSTNRVVL